MSPPKTTPIAPPDEATDDQLPAWKQASVERSLHAARDRATARTDRFVQATLALMNEKGSTDFTVQDVVDQARMSIRTFYNFFASKDDLLVAVHETILAAEVTPRLRAACDAEKDPVERVRAYIEAIFEISSGPNPVNRALTIYSNRLAETHPDDLARAFQPQIDLLEQLVLDATASGKLDAKLSPESAARLLHHTVLSAVHNRILGSEQSGTITTDELWTFCAWGIGVDPGTTRTKH
jgi:AcrR family transcriptional regulator